MNENSKAMNNISTSISTLAAQFQSHSSQRREHAAILLEEDDSLSDNSKAHIAKRFAKNSGLVDFYGAFKKDTTCSSLARSLLGSND
jgi:hypothetical protein